MKTCPACPSEALREGGIVVEGFTLIEILVVVTIIVMLTVGGIVSYSQLSKNSRDAKRKADVENIRAALEMYRSNHDVYPNTLSALTAGGDTYIKSIPTDPKGSYNDYTAQYLPLPSGCDTTSSCTSYGLIYKLESTGIGNTADPYGME